MEKLGFVQLTKVQGGFIPGTRRRAMDIPNAPRALPLICYEAIFPGDIAARDDRPGWIINLTNDGWFGISTGPYQHLQQARLRAIEQGLPLVRAANTGISAVIDPVGTDCRTARAWHRRRTGCQPAGRHCRRRFMRALAIFRPRSSWPPRLLLVVRRRVAKRNFLTFAYLDRLPARRKTATCAVPPVDRPTVQFAFSAATKNKIQSAHCSNCPQFFPILRAGFDGTGA